jgi:hypothetical protein
MRYGVLAQRGGMVKTARQWLLLCLGVACVTMAHAKVYQWKDAQGNVHFSDKPADDPATKQQVIKVQPASQFGGKPASKPVMVSPAADKQAVPGGVPAPDAKEKAANCTQAKGVLANLTQGGRVTRFNEKGEKVFLSDAERASEIQRMQSVVASWCS